MKKILFVTHEESRTGAPKVVYEVAREMKKSYDVKMVSLENGSMHSEFEMEFGRIIYGGTSEDDCRSIILDEKPDLVYVNSLSSYRFAIVAKKLDILVIFHVHELHGGFQSVFDEQQLSEFGEYADIFIVVSKPVENLLVNGLGCEASKVMMLNAFVNSKDIIEKSMDKYFDFTKDVRARGRIVVMGLGYFNRRKGSDYFVNAYKILNQKFPGKYLFLWVGNKGQLDFGGLGNDILILGEKENPYPYIKNSDIFILPSREDPFPLVALEAMALGKPVIAFKGGGGIPEAIVDCGVIVENMNSWFLADEIEKLSEDKNLMKNLGAKAIVKQKKYYDSGVIMSKIKKVVNSLIN